MHKPDNFQMSATTLEVVLRLFAESPDTTDPEFHKILWRIIFKLQKFPNRMTINNSPDAREWVSDLAREIADLAIRWLTATESPPARSRIVMSLVLDWATGTLMFDCFRTRASIQ
jgi:hypothetical protein